MIPNVNMSTDPLHQLLKDTAPDTWTEDHARAICQLETALAEAVE